MALIDSNRLEVHYVDHSDERYIVDIPVGMSPGLLNNLTAAMNGVSLNTFVSNVYVTKEIGIPNVSTPPTNPQAQNQLLWRVTIKETVSGQFGFFLIPGADTTLLATNSDQADLTTPEMTDLVNRVELVVLGATGNLVTVENIRITGS